MGPLYRELHAAKTTTENNNRKRNANKKKRALPFVVVNKAQGKARRPSLIQPQTGGPKLPNVRISVSRPKIRIQNRTCIVWCPNSIVVDFRFHGGFMAFPKMHFHMKNSLLFCINGKMRRQTETHAAGTYHTCWYCCCLGIVVVLTL